MTYTKKQKEWHDKQLSDTRVSLVQKLNQPATKIDAQRFLRLFWDDRQYDHIQQTMSLISRSSIDRSSMALNVTLEVTHPAIPCPFDHELSFNVNPTTKVMLWPRQQDMRPDADPAARQELSNILHDIAIASIDRAMLAEVLQFLCERCTHAQARFLAPFYQIVLQRAGLSEIAREVEVIKRVPTMPDMPKAMRQKIKHCIGLFTVHEMLGTFDKEEETTFADSKNVSIELGHIQWAYNAHEDYGHVRFM